MPYSYTIDVPRRLVIIVAESSPDLDEWFVTVDGATADPRFEPGFDLLYDRTRVDDAPDTARAREWASRLGRVIRALGGGRLAVIAAAPAVYGMARMASAFAEPDGVAIGVFWSEQEALEWLGHTAASAWV